MARFVVDDSINNYVKTLENLSKDTTPAIKQAVYFGANEVADAVRNEIEGLPTGRRNSGQLIPSEKRGLLEGLGLSTMKKDNGVINTKLGFNGYNKTKTRLFPNGEPNAFVARRVIKGTKGAAGNKFVSRAVKASKAKANTAMAKAFDDYVKNEMK